MKRTGPCDCLIRCGDDPWIKTGNAKPCAEYVRRVDAGRRAAAMPAALASLRDVLAAIDESDCAGLNDDPRIRDARANLAKT